MRLTTTFVDADATPTSGTPCASGSASNAAEITHSGAEAALAAASALQKGRQQRRSRQRMRFLVGVGLCAALSAAALRFDLTRLKQADHARAARAEQRYALVAAVDANDLAGVRVALERGGDPDMRDNLSELETKTPGELMSRWLVGHARDAFPRQARRGRPNAPATLAPTVLYQAVVNENAEIVALLLKRGADPNKASGRGDTPLMVACTGPTNDPAQRGRIIRMLLAHHADVHATNRAGDIALSRAMEAKEPETVRLLRDHEANRQDAR